MNFIKGILSRIFLNAFGTYIELNNANLPNTSMTVITNTFLLALAYVFMTYAWFNFSKAADIEDIYAEIRIISEDTRAFRRKDISASIRSQASRLCISHTAMTREKVNVEIERLQEEYRSISGHEYTIPDVCI